MCTCVCPRVYKCYVLYCMNVYCIHMSGMAVYFGYLCYTWYVYVYVFMCVHFMCVCVVVLMCIVRVCVCGMYVCVHECLCLWNHFPTQWKVLTGSISGFFS